MHPRRAGVIHARPDEYLQEELGLNTIIAALEG